MANWNQDSGDIIDYSPNGDDIDLEDVFIKKL